MSGWAWVGVGVVAWAATGVLLALVVGRALRRLDEGTHWKRVRGARTENHPAP